MVNRAGEDAAAREAWSVICDFLFSPEMLQRLCEANEALGITPALAKALMQLRADEPKPMSVLAGNWQCDASYVTSIVDGLEERGLVERQVLPADRRVRTIALTPAGEKAQQEWLDRMHEPPPGLFESFTAGEREALRDLLRKFAGG